MAVHLIATVVAGWLALVQSHGGHPGHAAGHAVSGWQEEVDIHWALPRRRLQASAVASGKAEEMDVSFEANGMTFSLQLKRNRALISSTAKHMLVHRDGSMTEGPEMRPCFYIGVVVGDPHGSAGISTCGGLSGIVIANGHMISIEPTSGIDFNGVALGEDAPSGVRRHTARRLTHEQTLHFQADIARYVNGANHSDVQSRRLAGASTKYVETFVVNDHSRYLAFGGQQGLVSLAAHSVSVMNSVTAIYRTSPTGGAAFPHTIQVVMVGQQTLLDADPWENTVETVGGETDCSSLLGLFNEWGAQKLQAGQAGLSEYDNRVLLSGRDFDGNTVGLAGMSVMCLMGRSGNVNMCGPTSGDIAQCAAVVAHEMGHNFGMSHDSVGNDCPSSGLIMEAVGNGQAGDQFSKCSATYITSFFSQSYANHGMCLENLPSRVVGDPICGNGFVEEGEACDCGASDCSGSDPCCNGNTCQLAIASYQCAAAAGPCCENCMFVAASANKECRSSLGSCDLPEYCPGGTDACPKDNFYYAGKTCTIDGFAGLCSMGRCESLGATCSVDINRDYDGDWDLTEKCASFVDTCGAVVCHKKDQNIFECGQSFTTHGKQMKAPEGTPCWYPGSAVGTRVGMCHGSQCKLPFEMAAVPICGNGGIDYGEECDCGSAASDPCCDCASCKLKVGKMCSSAEECCDDACNFKASGTVCRAAIGECDVEETCSGDAGICPSDVGKRWGTSCTGSDNRPSTCYGKICLDSLSKQCNDMTEGERPSGDHFPTSTTPDAYNECKGLSCCKSCEQLSGVWDFSGVSYTDPYFCKNCVKSFLSSTFTDADGNINTIHQRAAIDGTVLNDNSAMCLNAQAVTPAASCPIGQFLVIAVGRCVQCSPGCRECTGPSQFDCTSGICKYGRDSRGACAVSAEQVALVELVTSTQTTTTTSSSGQNNDHGDSVTSTQTTTISSSSGQNNDHGAESVPTMTVTITTTTMTTSTKSLGQNDNGGQDNDDGAVPVPQGQNSNGGSSSNDTDGAATSTTRTTSTATMTVQEVHIEFVVAGVDYDQLKAIAFIWNNFIKTIRDAIALRAGVSPLHVEVLLSAGSVRVVSKVIPKAGQINTAVTTLSDATTQKELVSAIAGLPDITNVSTGTIEVQSWDISSADSVRGSAVASLSWRILPVGPLFVLCIAVGVVNRS